MSIIEKFEAAAGILPKGASVVAAVSGGADSVALLHLLNTLPLSLTIAHFDHGTRAGRSAEDARAVARLGERLGVRTVIETGDVERARKAMKMSFQEAARVLRHRFLEAARERLSADWIALGHTAEDQVETLLINLLRGSGPRGLGAMAPVSGFHIRPLLTCYRDEIEAYLRKRGIDYLTDASNSDRRYLRNRVRLDLVPALQAINPRIKETLLRTAQVLKDEDEFLEQSARTRFRERFGKAAEGEAIPLQGFRDQPVALKRRWMRQVICARLGTLRRVRAGHIESLLDLVDHPRVGREVSLPGGLKAVAGYDSFYFSKTPRMSRRIQDNETTREPVWLANPGRTSVPESGRIFVVRPISRHAALALPACRNRVLLDGGLAGEKIGVRYFRPGDRFKPCGMKGRKKLKDYFIDKKIAAGDRQSIPLLVNEAGDILWVCGFRASALYPVKAGAAKVLLVEMEPASNPAEA